MDKEKYKDKEKKDKDKEKKEDKYKTGPKLDESIFGQDIQRDGLILSQVQHEQSLVFSCPH